MRIISSGNVGIGTTSPTAQLESIAPDGNKSSFRLGRSDVSSIWDFNHAGGDLRIYNSAGSGSDILLGVDSAGTVKNNNVGIGTASPQASLHVAGAIGNTPIGNGVLMGINSNYGNIHLNGSNGGYIDFSTSGTDYKGRILYSATSNYMTFNTASAERLRINSLGNVGIGTTSPSAKLHVNGPIAHKVYTASTLPSASPAGQRAFISDSAYGLATAIGAVVSGGGSNTIPVYSNGSSWRAG
jgi:hypothetical protein